MADAAVLALLDHIKDIGERTEKKLDQHIERDEKRDEDFLLPLWNAHQQSLGRKTLWIFLMTAISGAAGFLGSGLHK